MTGTGEPQGGVVFTQDITVSGGGRVYAVQHGDQYNYIYRDTPPYRVEPFPFAGPALPAGLERVPSRLLAARHQVVPFFPRPQSEALEAWRDDAAAGLSVRLVYAEGGSGKTRLAAEFAERSAKRGWAAALARHRSEVASAGGGDQTLTVRPPGLVLIVDYAERWPVEDLITLVRQHHKAVRDRLRILLLSRSAGAWWQGLAHQFSKLDVVDVKALKLEPLEDASHVRTGMYVAARDRFAEVFALPDPARIGVPDSLDDPSFALTLSVHMRALIDVDAASRGQEPPTGSDQATLSSYLLDRERDYWRSSHDRGRGPVAATEETMGRAVYVATLTSSLAPADAAAALARTGIADTVTACLRLTDDHARCYPPAEPGLVLDPLSPDRLGEDYLALTLPGHEEEFGYYATDPWMSDVPALLLVSDDGSEAAPYGRHALSVLIEAAHRWPHLVTAHLDPLLRAHPALALAAGGAALIRLAELTSLDLAVLEGIEPCLPEEPDTALDVGSLSVVERLTAHRLTLTDAPDERASLYRDLAWRRAVVGQHASALTAGREALRLYRLLAQEDPAAHRWNLAGALSDLGNILGEAGEWQDSVQHAREAVALLGEPAGDDQAGNLSLLAMGLSNLGLQLSKAGQEQEALEITEQSVRVYHALAGPHRYLFQEELALTLNNLGSQLENLGRWEEALAPLEESLAIRRELAQDDPDHDLRGLAGTLLNSALQLLMTSRPQEAAAPARECVDLYRELARENPGHRPRFAQALANLGNVLMSLDRHPEAAEHLLESVGLCRELAQENPAAYGELPPRVLNDYGLALMAAHRFEEAIAAHSEALALHRESGDARREAEVLFNLRHDRYLMTLNSIDTRVAQAMALRDMRLAKLLENDLNESFRDLMEAAQAVGKQDIYPELRAALAALEATRPEESSDTWSGAFQTAAAGWAMATICVSAISNVRILTSNHALYLFLVCLLLALYVALAGLRSRRTFIVAGGLAAFSSILVIVTSMALSTV